MSRERIIGPQTCHTCGGTYGHHSVNCSYNSGTWKIEYEIPPLRAIYHAQAENCTEEQAREMVRAEQPLWRIRKVTKISPL